MRAPVLAAVLRLLYSVPFVPVTVVALGFCESNLDKTVTLILLGGMFLYWNVWGSDKFAYEVTKKFS